MTEALRKTIDNTYAALDKGVTAIGHVLGVDVNAPDERDERDVIGSPPTLAAPVRPLLSAPAVSEPAAPAAPASAFRAIRAMCSDGTPGTWIVTDGKVAIECASHAVADKVLAEISR